MDCSLPGSSVHEILQTRKLDWVAIPFSTGSSRPGDQTQVSAESLLSEPPEKSMDRNLSKFCETVKDRESCCAAVLGITKSGT